MAHEQFGNQTFIVIVHYDHCTKNSYDYKIVPTFRRDSAVIIDLGLTRL